MYNLEVHGEHVYRVGSAGVLVHNQYHHIVSHYSNATRGFSQPWPVRSQEILRNAGVGLHSQSNRVFVQGHQARRHAEAYHQFVYKELTDATKGLQAGTQAYTNAVKSKLGDLTNQLRANPGLLDGVGL